MFRKISLPTYSNIMERQFRLFMLSATVGWMLAFTIGMTYFLLNTALWFQTPPTSAFLPIIVNYGLISGSIGGLGTALGLRAIARITPLTMIGLTLSWAVSFAIAFLVGWFLIGQNSDRIWFVSMIGMVIGGKLGGFLTGSIVRQLIPTGQVWRVAIGWSLALLVGNGIVFTITAIAIRLPEFGGIGWGLIGAIVGGAIAGLMGSRMTIQQVL
jgi:hypothetical protein